MNHRPDRNARPQRKTPRLRQTANARSRVPGHVQTWLAALTLMLASSAGARAQNVFAPEPVGSTSSGQSVTVTSSAAGTVSSVEVLTMGSAGQDFAPGIGASNCATATFPGTCTESVTFTPTAPGLRMGAVVLLNAGGSVIGTGYISGTGTGGLGVLAPGNSTTLAGVLGLYTDPGDGGPATNAQLDLPAGVALDAAGNIYIADSLHNRVRLVCSKNPPPYVATCAGPGDITTIAGNGNASYTGDGAAASQATLSSPNGVTLDGAGNVYIADTGNNVIRVITAATGTISTIAGNNSGTICAGHTDLVGDGCPATQATLNQPWGVTLDGSGNLYIADTNNHRIREMSASTGLISTIAGSGFTESNGSGSFSGDSGLATSADLNFPHAVAFDPAGNMYIPDSENNRVREVMAVGGSITAASKITTFAGNGNTAGPGCNAAPVLASSASLFTPSAVAVDAAGNVYIADTENNAIRKVNAATGELATLVQSGCGANYTNGGFATEQIYGPISIYLDGNGNLYFADYFDMIVQQVQGNLAVLNYTTSPVRQGSQSAPIDQTVENDGNAPLDVTALTPDANSTLGTPSSGTPCATGNLAVAADCAVAAIFAPTVAGNPLTANIDMDVDTVSGLVASNSPLDIELIGDATAVNSTTTSVQSSPNPSGFGQSVNFTVTVTTGSGTGDLTGTVSIQDTFNGATTTLTPTSGLALTLSTSGTTETGTATFSTSTLAVGKHSIVAMYNTGTADTGHFPSSSAALIQTVLEGTVTTIVSSQNPSAAGQSVTFTATVASSGGGGVTPDGTVTFMDGANTLSTQTLSPSGSNGVASFATSTLTDGVHMITAVYAGDPSNQISGSTSAVLNQDVQAQVGIALSSNANPSTFGNQVVFTATITASAPETATGTVIFLDNGVQIGQGTLSGTPATTTLSLSTLAVGTHPITATYAGDQYNGAASSAAPLNQVVNKALTTTSISAVPPASVIAGAPLTITATIQVAAGVATPSGTVTFTSGTSTLGAAAVNTTSETAVIKPNLAPGTYSIVATYSGDTDDAGSVSAVLPFNVVQATTATTVTVTPSPGIVTVPITLTANVTGNGGTPTGAVNFLANGSVIGAGTLNGSGAATLTTSALAVGNYTITAQYLGDTDDAGSVSGVFPFTMAQATTAATVTVTPSPGVVTAPITVTATVTGNGAPPTGTVNFLANGNPIGAGTLNGSGTATLTTSALTVGTYAITAQYLGDTDNAGSTSAAFSETVATIPTATSLGTSTTGGVTPQVILVATVVDTSSGPAPTGTVTFLNGTTPVGSATLNSSGVAAVVPNLTAGVNYSITANYGGDADHAPSTSQAVSITGTASSFNVTVAPAALTMTTSQNQTITVTLTSHGGFTDTIGMGCASLPAGVTCQFAPTSVTLPANGTASTQLTLDTNSPLTGGSTAANRPEGGRGISLAGVFLPLSALFGWLFWRLRRRHTGVFTLILVGILSAAALLATGCSGISYNDAAPGTYVIQVTGTGTNSSVIEFGDVTLTITK